ncbi:MAG TPA: hypothetical protein VH988_16960 [Thermoanaerobaculia bacterium]|jgi:hypothetical protein|nr:hypothetical protein [Thermoanaerobaculia bacterium]
MRGLILLVMAVTAAMDTTATTAWKTYRDPAFGFSLRYPESLVILPEKPLPERRPPLLHRVAFLDRQLAASETADLQPPQLAVEVFAPTSGPLRAWLTANGRLPAGSGVTDLKLSGAREGVRVRDPHLSAPNEFVYYATERGVVALIPLGAEGSAMLETFRLGAER